jgi:nicotinamidase-related amidase
MNLGVDHPKAAIIAIDLHRGHLDMDVATMPTSPEIARQVIAANKRLFDWARTVDIPVIHLLTQYRDVAEIASNPSWRTRAEDPNATRKNVLTKKRYDCFVGTDLDFTLRAHGINVLLITGVNTNSCVLATTTAANVRDYSVIVVKDCVETMDGPELHQAGILCIKTAFGSVLDTHEIQRLGIFASADK